MDEQQLKAEIAALKERVSYQRNFQLRRASGGHMYVNSPKMSLLLQWCQAVCTGYGVQVVFNLWTVFGTDILKVNNFGASFSDGRALCYLIHHYQPGLLDVTEIRQETTISNDHTIELDKMAIDEEGEGAQWTASFSPGVGLGGKTRKQQLTNEKVNFKLIHHAVSPVTPCQCSHYLRLSLLEGSRSLL